MPKNYGLKNLGWVAGLMMACSGSYVKDVGDIDGTAGQGVGGGPAAGAGGGPVSQAGQAGQGVGGAREETPSCVGCYVDTLGPAESTPFASKHNTVSTNVLDVTSTRLLEEIEATLLITRRTSAAWVVYEELGDQYALRLDVSTKLEPGDGVFRSGPVAVELEAGHRYAIGVYLNVGACYFSEAPESDQLSFAEVAGASLNGGGDYHDYTEIAPLFGQQFAMRLYTSMPDTDALTCPSDAAGLQALNDQPCAQDGRRCIDASPNCEHNYSVECTDGVWSRLTGLSAPCPEGGASGAGGAP